jgi:hypothetical protein
MTAIKRNPESEKDVTVRHRTDAELKALLHSLSVCPQCADRTVAALRAVSGIEPVGFAPCSAVCGEGILAAMTMQPH